MPILETAIGAAVSGGLGLMMQKSNDRRQINQQQKLTDMQVRANQQMAEYNYGKQMQMWRDTNYAAQKEELKKAGLNPALMYGMGGGGGTTTGNAGGGVSGGQAAGHSGEIYGMMQQGMQLQLLKAQKENIEADTENKQAQATKTSGVDTTLTKVNIDIAKIEREIKDYTSVEAQGIITAEYNKAVEELQLLRNRREISDRTMEQEIERTGAELAGAYLRNNQIKSQTNLTDTQIQEVIQSIQTQIKQLQQGDEHIKIQQIRNELIKTGIWVGAGTQIVGNLVSILNKPQKIAETITETFDDGNGQQTQSRRNKYK